jgi:molybdopterin-synthase adenylyltransferase
MRERYDRQVRLREIGEAGQDRIARATVCLIGVGALGSAIAEILVRGGIKRLVIADRDVVEISNLQRQVLFNEQDAANRLRKADGAAVKLRGVNRLVAIDSLAEEISADNIDSFIDGATVVMDGTDNFETRYLINDACLRKGIPWVYGGVVGMSGLVMPIVPGKGPCLRCMMREPPPPNTFPTCAESGVLASTPFIVGALEAACAFKLIVGDDSDLGRLTRLNVWTRSFTTVSIPKDNDCPTCVHQRFEFLGSKHFENGVSDA